MKGRGEGKEEEERRGREKERKKRRERAKEGEMIGVIYHAIRMHAHTHAPTSLLKVSMRLSEKQQCSI